MRDAFHPPAMHLWRPMNIYIYMLYAVLVPYKCLYVSLSLSPKWDFRNNFFLIIHILFWPCIHTYIDAFGDCAQTEMFIVCCSNVETKRKRYD